MGLIDRIHKRIGVGFLPRPAAMDRMEPPEVESVLVAVDGSGAADDATTYAIAIAERYAAELVALYVHGRDVDAVQAGEESAEEISHAAETYLLDVTDRADSAGVKCRSATVHGFSTHQKLVHPGSVILDAAEELNADFIVIPRETFDDATDEGVLAQAAEYALLYASQPLLAV